MLKKRYGKITETIPGRQWRWEVDNWARKKKGKIMDSELLTAAAGPQFHFHLVIEDKDGQDIVGFYIHYKARPVPKYTYAIGTTKGRVVRQHTAHSIPKDCKRCGHYNVCPNQTLNRAIERAGDDKCVIWFQFDECNIVNTGNLGEYEWTIPHFKSIRIGPYYSKGFSRISQEDLCCAKFNVDHDKRTNVTLSISQRQHRSIPCWFKISNLDGDLLYESPECRPGKWASIPYKTLVNGVGREGTLIVQISYVKEAVREAERIPVTDVQGILPPPGERLRKDDDGTFNLMDDDGFGEMEIYSEADSDGGIQSAQI